jgi:hypothetical protein
MECGASLLEAGRTERICREGGACVAKIIRDDAVDPLMECIQSSCDDDCAQRLEDQLPPLAAELEVLAASQQREECGIAYDLGRFGRLVDETVWNAMLGCWSQEYCLDIQTCLDDVQHEHLAACVEPLHLVLQTRPSAPRGRLGRRRSPPALASEAGSRRRCQRMCANIERSCRAACRPHAWSPNMRSMQDACENDCDFARFSCDSDCRR